MQQRKARPRSGRKAASSYSCVAARRRITVASAQSLAMALALASCGEASIQIVHLEGRAAADGQKAAASSEWEARGELKLKSKVHAWL